MVKKHLKRINAPSSWPIKRKGIKFVARPMSGPHGVRKGIALSVMIRDILDYARTMKELKLILNSGKILVNKKIRKNPKFPLGIMDIIEIPEKKGSYVVLLNKKGKFYLKSIKQNDEKLCRIINKTILKKGKVQLNLFDGRNIFVDKGVYKVGDSVVLDLKNNKIKNHLKLEKGSLIYLTGGKRLGVVGVVEEIKKSGNEKAKIIFKTKNGVFETFREYAFVINKEIAE